MALVITKGLTDDVVLQRRNEAEAEVVVEGTAPDGVSGALLVTISRKESPLPGWDQREIGTVAKGAWRAKITGLPTGGPYVVEFTVDGAPMVSATVRSVLVGDLWILAGQSNMEGCGDLLDLEPSSPYVYVLDMANRWHLAEEPLHWLCDSPDACHCDVTGEAQKQRMAHERTHRKKGAGLGLPFANAMVGHNGVPIGVLACAHGGTSMEEWSPELKVRGGGSLYGSMLDRLQAAGGKVAGILWYQGESDANPESAPLFAERFRELVASVRADCGNPKLPFYFVQLGRFVPQGGPHDPTSWNTIQELQRQLAAEIEETAVVPAIDLELDDAIHIGTQGLKRLGRRLAIAAQRRMGPVTLLPNIVVRTVRFDNAERTCVRVEYAGVSLGGFTANNRVQGFSFRRENGAPYEIIYKAEIDPYTPTDVLLHLGAPLPQNLSLHYGYGLDPVCNLVDGADLAAPVFGPVTIQ
jgi:sialate O-acetylesterase